MGENCVEYEMKTKMNVPALLDGEKKALTSDCGQENHVQAAYFIMRKLLSQWRQQVLLDPSTKPEPKSGPEIIASRLLAFVEQSKDLITFAKKAFRRKVNITRRIKKLSSTNQQDNFLTQHHLQVQFR